VASSKDLKVEAELIALRHEMRRAILRVCLDQERAISPLEISRKLQLPLPNVSYHVRVLANNKALRLVRTKHVRGSVQHFYRPSQRFLASPTVAVVVGREQGLG
jgi:DNA-binding transcriptional ArsR family regulator